MKKFYKTIIFLLVFLFVGSNITKATTLNNFEKNIAILIIEKTLKTLNEISIENKTTNISNLNHFIINEDLQKYLDSKYKTISLRNNTFNLGAKILETKFEHKIVEKDLDYLKINTLESKSYKYTFLNENTYEKTNYLTTLKKENNSWKIIALESDDEWDLGFKRYQTRNNNFEEKLKEFSRLQNLSITEDLNKTKNISNREIENIKEKDNFNRFEMVEYAKKYYLNGNKKYYDFDKLGGDCTNFVSQIIHAGGAKFDHIGYKDLKWYYYSSTNRTPSWTGVQYLYKYLISESPKGPKGILTEPTNCTIGDVVQVNLDNDNWYDHSCVIVHHDSKNIKEITIASRSKSSYNKPVLSYPGIKRYIHLTEHK